MSIERYVWGFQSRHFNPFYAVSYANLYSYYRSEIGGWPAKE